MTRKEKVWVVAQDRRGRKIKVAGSGLLGRAFQHELDHLDGKLYIDYLDSMDELIAVGRGDDEEGVAATAGRRGRGTTPKTAADPRQGARTGVTPGPAPGRAADPVRTIFFGSGPFAVPIFEAVAAHPRRRARRRRDRAGPAGRSREAPSPDARGPACPVDVGAAAPAEPASRR